MENKKILFFYLIIIFCLVVIFNSCSDDSVTTAPPPPVTQDLIFMDSQYALGGSALVSVYVEESLKERGINYKFKCQ